MTDKADTPDPQPAEPGTTPALPVGGQPKAGTSIGAELAEAADDLKAFGAWLRRVKPESWIVLGLAIGLVVGWEWIASQFSEAIIPSMRETSTRE